MMYQIHRQDILDWTKEYQGEPFHAMLLDPPYHLTSITKRFGKPNSAPAKGDVYRRASKGFMGQQWDGGDLAFSPETWAVLAEHLYPGGFGMAFASSRGWHRMAVAIEDAGLIIHPTIWLWNYASGFPKATRIDTQVDKAAGVERETIGRTRRDAGSKSNHDFERSRNLEYDITVPATALAQLWANHRYGLQALKPAAEPIICFQRPYEGRPVDCITQTGAGTLWIDGARIATEEITGWAGQPSRGYSGGLDSFEPDGRPTNGRWPSNLILCHLPTCQHVSESDWYCDEGCAIKVMSEQSGNRPGGSPKTGLEPSAVHKNTYGKRNRVAFAGYDDDGSAARFFHQADWNYEIYERLAMTDLVIYEPKASPSEREAGLDALESKTRHRVNSGGLENEPRFAPTQAKNHHPTVKPISLTKYLATLLLPPAGYHRRILVPFAGVASEMIGCVLAGWDEVIGVEKTAEYIPIAEARLVWWSQWPGWGQTDVDKILAASTEQQEAGQLPLFPQGDPPRG